MTAPETKIDSPAGMHITEENKLKGSLFIEAYGSLIDGISKDAESETEKALDITFNAIGAASATVMLAIDPLGSIIGAGVGWLIEHVSFLRDALNQLMGNPEEIQANVEATKARAAELRVLAEDHKSGLATFDGWTGASSENFKKSMDGMTQELDELAQAVETKAKIVAIMGMLVTVLRDIVRDLIAQLIGSLIAGALIAAAAAIPTFGASIAIFGGFAVGKAVALGVNIASRVARVVAALGRQMKRIGDLDDIMEKISKGWQRFENVADVAEIGYEGYKAQAGVDKKIDEAMAARQPGGGGGTTASATATPHNTVLNRTVAQPDNAVREMNQLAPMQTNTAREMNQLAPMQTNTAQAYERGMVAERAVMEPAQTLHRAVMEPEQTLHRTLAEPAQTFHRSVAPQQTFEALAPMQPVEQGTPAHTVHARLEPMQTGERMHEQLQPMQTGERMGAASDSTMASGVSMTAGTPAHEPIQPMQAREMYISNETPSEPLQGSYEPLARTQMSHAYDALEPSHPVQAFSRVEDEQPVYESVNPLMAAERVEPTAAYEAGSQAGGAAAPPLRAAAAFERPVRPTE
ncbi:hypothetical protein [Lentzea sp. E54]|uniref:hypothetical protein n=1 Tax=Lentzea xerophila TaxID=3435883 RepID=UPI003DA51B7A